MMRMLGIISMSAGFLLAGCNSMSSIKPGVVRGAIDSEMQRAAENRNREAPPDAHPISSSASKYPRPCRVWISAEAPGLASFLRNPQMAESTTLLMGSTESG